jgi:transcriptional regulator with XRE-family HTH domain
MTFRQILAHELTARRARNRRYSLRSFARSMRIDHSTLSQILRGRRVLTPAAVRDLAGALGLVQPEIDRHLVETAILRLVRRTTFRADSREIARRAGASTDEINIALQRLLRTGVLSMEGSRWRILSSNGRSWPETPSP